MPAAWNDAHARFAQPGDAALSAAADQLSALFGDKVVLAKMRSILDDCETPAITEAAAPPLTCSKPHGNDRRATFPIFANLLDEDAFRSTP